ncbi:MAG: rod-binding protein [Lachnospiraceae bacterium]|nr:rod-binding protein [Lachnospiraceae bacterium]
MNIGGMGLDSYLSYVTENAGKGQQEKVKQALENAKTSAAQATSDDELMEVCKTFEAYFVEQVMKEVVKTTTLFGDDTMSSSTRTLLDYYKDQALQTASKSVTDQQNLGLAQMLYDQMKRNGSV